MDDQKYQIRLARLEDIPYLPTIEQKASELFSGTENEIVASLDCIPVEILLQQQEKGLVWVASTEQGLPVGFAVVTVVDSSSHLEELSVDPLHGQRGLGTRLVDVVCDWARTAGYRTLTLSTFRDVSWNAPFYKKIGFTELSEERLGEEMRNLRIIEKEKGLDISARVIMIMTL